MMEEIIIMHACTVHDYTNIICLLIDIVIDRKSAQPFDQLLFIVHKYLRSYIV
jgi:hypothetical protein